MSLKKCEDILGRTSKKKEQLAVYFCEDPRTLELDKLLTCLLTFITEFNKAIEVWLIMDYSTIIACIYIPL